MRVPATLLALVTMAAAPYGAQPPDVRAHIAAYVKALSSGSAEQFEAMAKEHFTAELFARNASQREPMLARVHADFGALEIASATMRSPTHAELEMHSATNSMPLTIALDFEAQPPYRITQVALRAGGPARRTRRAAASRCRLSADEHRRAVERARRLPGEGSHRR